MRRALAAAVAWVVLACAGCAAEKANGRPWVHDLEIDGVHRVSKKDLASHLAVEETSWIPLAPKKYLDPFTVEQDQKRIAAYYAAHGYFGAQVTKAEVLPRDDKNQSVDIKIAIDEGPPTHITAVTTDGIAAVGGAGRRLDKRVHEALKPGAVFDHDVYLDQKSRIEARLRKLGYAWASVDGQVDIDRDARTAVVHLVAKPGPRARFGQLKIEGASRISARLVWIHAEIKPGSRFDPDTLEAARGRLYNLGVFSTVKVEYARDPQHEDVADVIIGVREGQLHELRVGGGFGFESSRYDVHASVTYIKHSFLGGLRTLKLRVEPGWVFLLYNNGIKPVVGGPSNGPSLTADATFVQPDFLAPLYELSWTVGYDVGIDYAYEYHGPRTALGVTRPFWNHRVNVGLSYNFNFLLFFHTADEFERDPGKATQLFGYTNPYRVAWLQQDLSLDLRDRPLDAHSGGYLGLQIEEGGVYVGSAFTYEKLQPDLRLYAPLGKRVTLAGRLLFGQMYVQGSDGSPITRRFFLGGPSSHRGFNYNRLSLQVPSGQLPGSPPLPIGGDQMFLVSGELRIDVARLFGNWFGVTLFADGGDVAAPRVSETLRTSLSELARCPDGVDAQLRENVDLAHLHWAVGGGLRYKTVIGTIRVDVGVRVNRTAQCEADHTRNPDPNSRVAFHLSIGEAF